MNHTKERRVFWTTEEWRTYALAIASAFQGGELPKTIPMTILQAAMQTFPEDRRRPVDSTSNAKYRPKLLEILNAETPPPAPAETIEHTPEPEAPAPGAIEDTGEKKQKRAKVFWRTEEYLSLARELYRLNPHDTYLKSETLASLTTAALWEAQRILPQERRRHLHQVSNVRPGLLEAFKTVRAELEVEKSVRDAAQAEAEADARALAEKRQHIIDHPEAYSAPLGTATRGATEPPQPEPGQPNVHEIALRVLVDMLVPALAERLVPELAKRINALGAAPAPVASPVPAAPVVEDPLEHGPPPGWEPPGLTMPATTTKVERKTLIGILGLKPVHLQEVRAAFPMFEFITDNGTHSTRTLKAMQSCERILSVNTTVDSMGQITDKMLAKHFGDRYVRVQGGMSMAKRQIQIWIQAGVLK